MNYSPEFKEAMLRRMLPPNNESITKIAKEEGLSEQTLRNWRDKARKEGYAVSGTDASPDEWRNRPLQGGKYPYVYVDGIYLRRNWGGEYENMAILVAIAVKVKLVTKTLKAIHAQKSKKAAYEKAKAVVAQLREMKLKEAAKKVEDSVGETLTYCDFPYEHWIRIRTNNVIERLNQKIRRRTRVVGSFPDGNSAIMLVYARLRHVASTQWGNKKYMNMKHLEAALEDVSIAG